MSLGGPNGPQGLQVASRSRWFLWLPWLPCFVVHGENQRFADDYDDEFEDDEEPSKDDFESPTSPASVVTQPKPPDAMLAPVVTQS